MTRPVFNAIRKIAQAMALVPSLSLSDGMIFPKRMSAMLKPVKFDHI